MPALSKQVPVCAACVSKVLIINPPFCADSVLFDGQFETQPLKFNVVCTNCGFEFDDYFETGRFGCVRCYDVFNEKIFPIVREIHGCTHHNGSRPG